MAFYTPVELTVDVTGEKLELLNLLRDQRNLFLVTVRNLTDEQARQRTTVSTLTLGGLAKHLATGEQRTVLGITEPDENAVFDPATLADNYTLLPDETLEQYVTLFTESADAYDRVIAEADLDTLIPMPTTPWAPEREWLSIRTLVVNKLRETAHHCGHADIIREALDGQTTMAAISEGQPWADEDWI
ncbi:MAG TPA: DUF664 domain-containing protein [Gordonia sp. (in: high G+C Gram-positive bacteria)]|uniref:mycothiol transferase n=1 Tax=unclassified Gordonia (in: high G+C Gram-positive bacteria) TaxID=2657482 RepID=UPI000FB31990|nr:MULTISPECIES: DUF664 domain-containing protein [unclassified Gordonia (in: high G+C Gram-positive bacteria)]RUP40391.1 MAG: DUF664 domain-containing protein [Gordonia sp. (in: high G+C Gram-positive bacteria)]HNP57096.1 DUF664 domain-containing protein [Gordonia sp. (in: high G+C Gram-positive bacteria)]HRC49367.1 DUF664 domain-containing protein [Gordonia sp. (in: high G+C Gram-positive bacteria)]